MRATALNRRRTSSWALSAYCEPLEERRLLATIFTANAAGNLYSVDTNNGNATLIGNMGQGVDQIASTSSINDVGQLYATDGVLYNVNPANGGATPIGNGVGVGVTGLGLAPQSGVLYGVTTALYAINLNTGAASLVGSLNLPTVNDVNSRAGDVAYGPNGTTLYLSADVPEEKAGDELFSVNTSTGAATLIGSIGFTNVTGLALGDDGVLYGVTGTGQILSINTSTGGGTFVSTCSAGAMTDATSFVLPPPPPLTPPAASFTSATYTTNLNGGSAVLTVQLTGGAASSEVDVFYQTVDDSATANTDYVPESGTIVFPVGATQEQVLIPILNSQALGSNKDFFVELTDPDTDQFNDSKDASYVLVSPYVADVTIQNVNSAFEISPNTVTVSDADKTATVTVQRLGVTSDEETVDFATVYSSNSGPANQAVPGVNYQTVLSTLTFLPGQTTQTVQIPILAAASTSGSEEVTLQLSNPQVVPPSSGSPTAQNLFVLGAGNSSTNAGDGTLIITNVDTTAPTISNVTINHVGKKITSLTVQFNEAVTQSSAEALTSYGIFNRDKEGPYGTGPRTSVKLSLVSYDPATNTATLTPKKPLAMNKVYQFVAYGSNGVTDVGGQGLEGNVSASNDYSIFFGLGTHLQYVDADGDNVSLKLSGPGLLDLTRAFNGNASSLILEDTTPQSVLSGKVHKGKYGDGQATIDLVGPTGGVNDELTKPPFIIVSLS